MHLKTQTQVKTLAKHQDFALAGLSAAFGDPEAMKTVVDVVANMTAKGLSHLPVKDQNKGRFVKKNSESGGWGADSLMDVLSYIKKSSRIEYPFAWKVWQGNLNAWRHESWIWCGHFLVDYWCFSYRTPRTLVLYWCGFTHKNASFLPANLIVEFSRW